MKSAIESVGAYAQAERAAGWQTFVAAWARRARKTATALWARARDRYEAYRLRMVAETLYTELSKLSDADLERRGMARGDLYRLTRAMTER